VIDSPYEINPAGSPSTARFHAAPPRCKCVLHVHSLNGIAVSALKAGVLPLSQQSIFVLSCARVPRLRRGRAARRREAAPRERPRPQDVLDAPQSRALDGRRTIPDAFLSLYFVRIDVSDPGARARHGVDEDLIAIDPRILATAQTQGKQATRGLGGAARVARAPASARSRRHELQELAKARDDLSPRVRVAPRRRRRIALGKSSSIQPDETPSDSLLMPTAIGTVFIRK